MNPIYFADGAVESIRRATNVDFAGRVCADAVALLLDDAKFTSSGRHTATTQARRVAAEYRAARARIEPDVWGKERRP